MDELTLSYNQLVLDVWLSSIEYHRSIVLVYSSVDSFLSMFLKKPTTRYPSRYIYASINIPVNTKHDKDRIRIYIDLGKTHTSIFGERQIDSIVKHVSSLVDKVAHIQRDLVDIVAYYYIPWKNTCYYIEYDKELGEYIVDVYTAIHRVIETSVDDGTALMEIEFIKMRGIGRCTQLEDFILEDIPFKDDLEVTRAYIETLTKILSED